MAKEGKGKGRRDRGRGERVSGDSGVEMTRFDLSLYKDKETRFSNLRLGQRIGRYHAKTKESKIACLFATLELPVATLVVRPLADHLPPRLTSTCKSTD